MGGGGGSAGLAAGGAVLAPDAQEASSAPPGAAASSDPVLLHPALLGASAPGGGDPAPDATALATGNSGTDLGLVYWDLPSITLLMLALRFVQLAASAALMQPALLFLLLLLLRLSSSSRPPPSPSPALLLLSSSSSSCCSSCISVCVRVCLACDRVRMRICVFTVRAVQSARPCLSSMSEELPPGYIKNHPNITLHITLYTANNQEMSLLQLLATTMLQARECCT